MYVKDDEEGPPIYCRQPLTIPSCIEEGTPAVLGRTLETLLNDYNQTQTIKNRLQIKYQAPYWMRWQSPNKLSMPMIEDEAQMRNWGRNVSKESTVTADGLHPQIELEPFSKQEGDHQKLLSTAR